MLIDNTDGIVKKEIPEFQDEINSLTGDIEYILNDPSPAEESNGINLIGLNGSSSPRSSATPLVKQTRRKQT